jgi:hypothetical protein
MEREPLRTPTGTLFIFNAGWVLTITGAVLTPELPLGGGGGSNDGKFPNGFGSLIGMVGGKDGLDTIGGGLGTFVPSFLVIIVILILNGILFKKKKFFHIQS